MENETVVETNQDVPADTPKPEKVQKYKIFLNSEGNECGRKPLGPGKPPKNSTKDADGNLICPFVEKVAASPVQNSDYITLDVEGNELHREPRKPGRGRPKKGFERQTDGDHAGHYVKVLPAEVPAVVSQDAPAAVVAVKTDETAVAADGGEIEDNFLT